LVVSRFADGLRAAPSRQVPLIDVFGFRVYRSSLAGNPLNPDDPYRQASA